MTKNVIFVMIIDDCVLHTFDVKNDIICPLKFNAIIADADEHMKSVTHLE